MANTIIYVVQTLRSSLYLAFTITNEKNLHIWRIVLFCGSCNQHKRNLQHSLLAQFPLVCGKKCKNSLQKEGIVPKWDVHSGKTIPFPMREFLKCSLCKLKHLVYAQSKPADVEEFPSLSRETGAYPCATPTE